MIQHVGLEVAAASLDDEVAFWGLLGFAEVAPLAGPSRWVEREGFQVHLLPDDAPSIPARGHLAVVVGPAYDAVVAALRGAGHEAAPRQEYWGAPRTQVVSPAGHRVEITAAAPPTQER